MDSTTVFGTVCGGSSPSWGILTKIYYNTIFQLLRGVAQLVEYTLWERGVAGSSPVSPTGGIMEENDRLPKIIALISIILFLIFVFTISRPKEIDGLQGGDIQHAIDTNQ